MSICCGSLAQSGIYFMHLHKMPWKLIQVYRLGRSNNKIKKTQVECKFEKQTLSMPRRKFGGSKKLNNGKQLNKSLTRNLRQCKDPLQILQTLELYKTQMDCINIATAFVSIANILKSKMSQTQEVVIQRIYEELFQLLEQNMDQMASRALANCLWSLGKLVERFGFRLVSQKVLNDTLDKLYERQIYMVYHMNGFDISNSLWAMAKVQYVSYSNIKALVEVAVNETDLTGQDISNALWALAKIGYTQDIKILMHLVEQAKTHILEMTPQAISNCLWAVQELRYYDEQFLDIAENQILNSNMRFSNQAIANILMACTDFGVHHKEAVISTLMGQYWQGRQRDIRDCAVIAYSLAVLNAPTHMVEKIFEFCVEVYDTQSQDFQELDLRQLRRAHLEYLSRGQQLNISDNFSKICIDAQQKFQRSGAWINIDFIGTVHSYLCQEGFASEKQVLVQDDELDVDILINGNSENQLAIRIWTFECYACNDARIFLGRAQAVLNLLVNFGWKVVTISEAEWNYNTDYKKKIVQEIRNRLQQA
eukprot:TRINITY_DN4502_c0_g1_i2.p1 TRINITY_DN4502_c0_g1~~TRINITY_DN4502_c0_g1_i2.p1  ORF type:complete len:536 (-),score=24.93 TRINITY_DN4502_c0_g1_i2:737-2344(-)